jgi:hypothetical protein
MENPQHHISNEAQQRVASARVREFAFKLKPFVGNHHVETADLEMLARAILDEIERVGNRVEREAVVVRIVGYGRSRAKAEHLASLVLS